MSEHVFEAAVPLKAVSTDGGDALSSPWIVEGRVASDRLDYDKELLDPNGVWKGLDTFDVMGKGIDYEHMYRQTRDPKYMIGVGKERRMEGGTPFLRAELYQSASKPLAKSVWEHINTKDSEGNPGYAGFSVEGRILGRDPGDKRIVKAMEIHRVTISMTPKGLGRTRVVPIGTVLKALHGDEEALADFEVPDGVFDWMKGALDAEGVEMPAFRSVAEILKAYITGAAVVMPGPAPDASALRGQAIVAPPRARKKSPGGASRRADAQKALTADDVRASRRKAWRDHVVSLGYPASLGDKLMAQLEK